jgi:N-acetylglutamate synthase-like GNAT family acetyltransferase
MKFKLISPSHAYYREELMLRWEALSKPMGMPPGSEVVADEMECLHFLLLDDKNIAGCVVFHPDSESSGQLIQLALAEKYRSKGIGRKLMHYMELELAKRGISDIYLFAKDELQGFFEKMGYRFVGDAFENMGFNQRVMKKNVCKSMMRSA